MKADGKVFEVLESMRAPWNDSTRFFPSQFEDEVGFHVYQMPGPCPPIRKLNLRPADFTHLSTSLQKEDTQVRVCLQTAMPVASL